MVTPQISVQKQNNLIDEGWEKYQVISILGEGSYGKVFKVIKKDDLEANSKLNQKSNITARPSIKRLGQPNKTNDKQKEYLVIKEL